MPVVYVTAYVPAAARPAAEAALVPYLVSPNAPGVYTFSVPLVPYPGEPDAAPTHYGCCSRIDGGGALAAALASLAGAVPGSAYQVISPWRSFSNTTHWVAWLAANGLQVRITTL